MKYLRSILDLTIPSVVSNITVPLLSLVDTSIVGHMSDANNIGGIYIGSTIFSMIYWVFAFLRMGTTGIIAQARGAGDTSGIVYGLCRSLFVGLLVSFLLCCLQIPLLWVALQIVSPPDGLIAGYATQYFRVCIWGAPAMLTTYCLSGWFIGMRDTKTPMMMAITQNVVNIIMSLFFVYGLDADIRGVAAGTVVGLYCGVLIGLVRLRSKLHFGQKISLLNLLQGSEMWRFIKVNHDLFLRTICLVVVTVSFTRFSSQLGEGQLNANAIAMQFFIFYSYFMDGLANAGEAMSGEFWGRKDGHSLCQLIDSLFRVGIILTVGFMILYYIGCSPIVSFLTNDPAVYGLTVLTVRQWVWLIPLVSFSAFIWDGVFIGLTWSRGMLISTFSGLVVFFCIHSLMSDLSNSSCLWLSFLLYLATRGFVQWIIWIKNKPVSH